MKFCSLDEAFKGNTYIPGDQPNEKPYGPYTSLEPEYNQEIPQEEDIIPKKLTECETAFNHCKNCPICNKHIQDIIDIQVRERLLLERNNQPNNMLIIIILIILAWMLLK